MIPIRRIASLHIGYFRQVINELSNIGYGLTDNCRRKIVIKFSFIYHHHHHHHVSMYLCLGLSVIRCSHTECSQLTTTPLYSSHCTNTSQSINIFSSLIICDIFRELSSIFSIDHQVFVSIYMILLLLYYYYDDD